LKISAKGEVIFHEETDQDYSLVNEFLEEDMKSPSIYESGQEMEFNFWDSEHNIHTSISTNNNLRNKSMNFLLLPDKYHFVILDGGAETCKGWEYCLTQGDTP
jgi:hypothetical protein